MKEVALLLGLEGNNEEDDAALNNVEETYEDAYVDGEEVAYEVASYEDDEVELYVSLHDEARQHDEGQKKGKQVFHIRYLQKVSWRRRRA